MEELKKVYNSANDEWRGIIICGLYTGQRLGDIAKLRWTAIDLANKTINFLTSKTSRPTIVPMAEPVYNFIMELGSNDDPNAPLFPNAVKALGKHDRTSHLSNQFYDIMASAGIVPHRPHTKRLKEAKAKRGTNPLPSHCLRTTATSLLKNRGTAEAVAMDIIGHESKSISQNYTHIDMETKRKAIDSLPDITK